MTVRGIETLMLRYERALKEIADKPCHGRNSSNEECDLNSSDDPKEYCLVHIAREALK